MGHMKPLAIVVSVLLFAGCTGPSGAPTPAHSATNTCVGDAAATTELLNLNATPAVHINGAEVSVFSISRDADGPVAAITVLDGDVRITSPDLRVGSVVKVRASQLKVTQICVVENLPSPMAPGTSRGTVGLADAS